MKLPKWVEKIAKRADHAAGIRSDDFGHSVHEMMVWQSGELDSITAEEIPKLIELAKRALEVAAFYGDKDIYRVYTIGGEGNLHFYVRAILEEDAGGKAREFLKWLKEQR